MCSVGEAEAATILASNEKRERGQTNGGENESGTASVSTPPTQPTTTPQDNDNGDEEASERARSALLFCRTPSQSSRSVRVTAATVAISTRARDLEDSSLLGSIEPTLICVTRHSVLNVATP